MGCRDPAARPARLSRRGTRHPARHVVVDGSFSWAPGASRSWSRRCGRTSSRGCSAAGPSGPLRGACARRARLPNAGAVRGRRPRGRELVRLRPGGGRRAGPGMVFSRGRAGFFRRRSFRFRSTSWLRPSAVSRAGCTKPVSSTATSPTETSWWRPRAGARVLARRLTRARFSAGPVGNLARLRISPGWPQPEGGPETPSRQLLRPGARSLLVRNGPFGSQEADPLLGQLQGPDRPWKRRTTVLKLSFRRNSRIARKPAALRRVQEVWVRMRWRARRLPAAGMKLTARRRPFSRGSARSARDREDPGGRDRPFRVLREDLPERIFRLAYTLLRDPAEATPSRRRSS